jgi:hypothetical protein
MKQLLHAGTTAGGGGDILAFALGHRAFIYHHTSGAAAVANDDSGGGDIGYLTELDLTIPATATTTPSDAVAATTALQTAVADDSGNDKKKKKNVPPGSLDVHHESTIQAIAIRAADDDDSSVVVGVALQNKQLLMFRRQAAGRSYPILAHTVTDKRVTKLLFAPLDDNDTNNMVLVATDMLGDATAYEIPSSHSSTGTDGSVITTKVQRKLLLGHTASVLTDLCLVRSSPSLPKENRSNYFLLTADRDEKIRVSYFPRCYDIYGYLLAHTAFVTSVTPLPTTLATTTTTTTPLVASTGGDGQLIVWNVATCEKIASCAIIGAGDTNNNNHNVIPTKVLALCSNNHATTTTLLVIGDRDPHLYGFTYYGDGDSERMVVQPMKEPFNFPAVPIDFIVGWYNNRRADDDNSREEDTTTPIPTATLAVLFQDAPYIRCYDCCTTTTTTMGDDGRTMTTTTLQLTETTPHDLTMALSMAISSSSSSSSTSNDIIHVPDSLLEKRGKEDGIVLVKHAREDAEKTFSPNDPERLPGSKEKIVLRHAKRQQKKQKKTKITT